MTRWLTLTLTVLALGGCARHARTQTTPAPVAPGGHAVCGDAKLRLLCAPSDDVAPTQEAIRPVRVDTNLRTPHVLDNSAA